MAMVMMSSSISVSGGAGFVGTVSSVGSFSGPPSMRLSGSGLAVAVMSCSVDVSGRLALSTLNAIGFGTLVSTSNAMGFGTSRNHKFGIVLNQ